MGKRAKRIIASILTFVLAVSMTTGIGEVHTAEADEDGFFLDAEKLDVTGLSDKQAIPEGTSFADNYFKVVGSMLYKIKDGSSMVALEIGKNYTGRFTFTTFGDADVVLTVGSTGGSNTSAIAIVDANNNIIPNNEGVSQVTGTSKTQLSYTGLAKGSYAVVVTDDARNTRLYSILVTDYGAGAKQPRALWKDVQKPVITNVVADNTKGTIEVFYDMVIGYDGADSVSIDMLNEKGKKQTTLASAAEGAKGSVVFKPTASGTYSFRLYAIRENESKKLTVSNEVSFILPLAKSNVSSATSAGNGNVSVEYSSVPEATGYDVYYRKSGDAEYALGVSTEADTTVAVISGLAIGSSYEFAVKAKRNTEIGSLGASASCTVTEDAKRKWAFAAFGPGVDTKNNYVKGGVNEGDGSVNIASINGKGKIQPTSTDGLAFYYTTINPQTENFVLSGKIHVNKWTYSNAQEGFGIMACDRVGAHGDGSAFYNNSYMLSATKIVYYYDAETDEVFTSSSDTTKSVQMKLGIGAQEKLGATADLIAKMDSGKLDTADFAKNYSSVKMYPLETTGRIYLGGNIVGNNTNTTDIGTYKELVDFDFKLERNNTGYILSYTNEKGVTEKTLYYDIERDNLTQIDADNIYVGFWASRNFDITVSDIVLTTSDAATDAPAEQQGITLYGLKLTQLSALAVGTPDYKFILESNADGVLTLKNRNAKTTIVENQEIKANQRYVFDTTLVDGYNALVSTFTPAEGFKPAGEHSALSDYSTVENSFGVEYRAFNGDVMYVSPEGSSFGKGTKENPFDLLTAVSRAHAGVTIYLAGGTYKPEAKITIGRGQSGTEEAPIYILPDPTATERPVFDFVNQEGKGSGITIGGDWWYVGGFDVTNAKEKGIQISGNHNVVDNVNTYNNLNTGLQIARLNSLDQKEDWPTYNLILNCTSHDNADPGYEDADGFAAKLTVGEGNVFDGCIAYCNADDGWDLFAKPETGSLGVVTIRNCVAYRNGFLSDGTVAGNGNGFKLGGSSITGYHRLINSVAYENKTKGIDSNSCPDIQIENCVSVDNGSANVAFYTNDAKNTDFEATNLVSFRTKDGSGEYFKFKGTQDNAKIYKESNYYWPEGNTSSVVASADWFKSVDTKIVPTRNADGTLNMNGLFEMSSNAPAGVGAFISGTPSIDFKASRVVASSEAQESVPTPTATPAPTATPVPTETPIVTEAPVPTEVPSGESAATENAGQTQTPSQEDTDEGSRTPIIVILLGVAACLIVGISTVANKRKKK